MEDMISQLIQDYCACLNEWNAAYEDYAKSVELNFTSLSILSALYDTENCTQKMLCEQCFLPKQTVNTSVTAFYKKGWNKTIHFTEEGRREAERIMHKVRESERQAMKGLSKEERELLISLTRRYVTDCINAMKGL